MGKRVTLNDGAVDMISGGAFNFSEQDGKATCYVDGIGTFYCNKNSSDWIIKQMTKPGASVSDITNKALEAGVLWN